MDNNYIMEHADKLKKIGMEHQTVVINAYGGAGAGKTTACLEIASQLKKEGYVAEYVSEYAKELVWNGDFDKLDGSLEHQSEILQEQISRIDRLYGKVDFIVTDAPILLNVAYSKDLTDSYEQMVYKLQGQYDNFNFVVQRDVSKFEQEGRMQNLEESIQKDGEIKALLNKHNMYYKEYSHSAIDKVVTNAIKTHTNIQARKQNENAVMTKSQYKGFAYEQNNQKPVVIYGESKDEILEKLQAYNKARVAEKQFITCNIGSLNEEGKYADYHKYNVADGTEIEKKYFKIPPMSKEEFLSTKRELEEHGARFDPVKRMMYVEQQEDMSFFEPYINDKQNIEQRKSSVEENVKDEQYEAYYQQDLIEKPKVEIPDFKIEDPIVKVNFSDGRPSIYLKLSDIGLFPVLGEGISADNMWEKLTDQIREHMQEEKDYQIGISKESNECSVYFKDGRDTIIIHGEDYNVDFRDLKKAEVEHFVNDYMDGSSELHTIRQQEMNQYNVGENIDIYIPRYDEYQDVSGIEHIEGHIKEVIRHPQVIETLTYVVEDNQGVEHKIEGKEIYSPQQTDIILKAIDYGIENEELSLLSNPKLSAAQMNEIFDGYKDGLNHIEVALYANPLLQSSQMDICRIGLIHGVDIGKLPYKPLPEFDWVAARNQLNVDIKEHRKDLAEVFKRAGFTPSEKLVKGMEELNHLKHRPQSIKDICEAYKDKDGLDLSSKEGKLIKEIGDSLKYQELSRSLVPGT